MFDRLNNLLGLKSLPTSAGTGSTGKSRLPPPEEPKVKPKQQSFPGHVTSIAVSTSAIPKTDLNLANREITSSFRFGATTSATIRSLVRANPDFSAALSGHLRMGIPERYIPPAYNPDGTFNVDATRLVMEILNRFDANPGWDTGFTTTGSIRSISEALGKEIAIEGACMMELVLDKARLPRSFAPIAVSTIKFYDDWKDGVKTLRPVQVVGGEEIDLDQPNIFYVALDASLLDAYPHPPMEAAIQPVLAASTFLDQLRRLCERHVFPRYVVTIDEEKLRKYLPEELLLDDAKREEKLNDIVASIASTVNDLGVEDALVIFDFITISFIEGQDGDVPATFDTVKEIYDAKIATGAKSNGSILGHSANSQNIASTETLLAMLTANSMVRLKLQEMYSKALTLAARLFGMDVTVKFEFDEIDLRPAAEVEAFKSMRQDRILRQVSLGYMLDEEACLRLTGRLPPTGFEVHWNTMFMDPASGLDAQGNGFSGTGAGGGQSGGGAGTQSRKSNAPANKGGGK